MARHEYVIRGAENPTAMGPPGQAGPDQRDIGTDAAARKAGISAGTT